MRKPPRLNAQAPHITQRMNLAVSARSPIERITEFAASRGWKNLRLLSPDWYPALAYGSEG